ncbi:MAG: Holliday junction resolvase RuvX [Polyangiales bacterium]
MRVLGVDPGSVRIGLALSDEDGLIASPHSTLKGGDVERGARALVEQVKQLGAERVVVGLPLRLDGTEGDAARRARRLAERVAELGGVEVELWDERLSSRAAERALSSAGVRGRARKQHVDRVAAALILQSYLDAKRTRDTDGTDTFED